MVFDANRVVVATIATSKDRTPLHLVVKVSPTPEGASVPGPEAVLTTALAWGYSPFTAKYLMTRVPLLGAEGPASRQRFRRVGWRLVQPM
jgi:hypothetical protein